jgi:hypothetical protein
MMPDVFDSLVELVKPALEADPRMLHEDKLSAEERLSATLRFLASGLYFFYPYCTIISTHHESMCIVKYLHPRIIINHSDLYSSGDDYTSLEFLLRIPARTLARIIPESCEAIIAALTPEYMQVRKSGHP